MNEIGNNHAPNTAGVDASRSASLSEKVRSLRLADKMNTPGGASGGMVWFLLVLVLILAAVAGYNAYATQSALKRIDDLDKKAAVAAKKDGEDPSASAGGEGEPAERADEIALQYKGVVVPIAQIQVSPQVGGKVVFLDFREGEKVKKGKLLARIEETEFKHDHDRASAAVAAATQRCLALTKYREKEARQSEAELDDAMAQRSQAEADYLRVKTLRDAKAISDQEYDEAESRFKSLVARVERLKLAVEFLKVDGPRDAQIGAALAEKKQAEAERDKARWRLDNCEVRAPIDGMILSKKAELHNQVNPAAFSNGLSASLCEMADLTELEVDVSVVERDRARVKVNQACRVRLDAWPGKVYDGYVSRIMPQADRGKNAVPVRVKIAGPRLRLDVDSGGPFVLPEMSAVVTFLNSDADPKALESADIKALEKK